jgi:hypothetical protein
MTTAEVVFDLDNTAIVGPTLIQAQKLQLTIAEELMNYFDMVQSNDNNKLVVDPNNILQTPDVSETVSAAIVDIAASAVGTPWQAHFSNPDVQAAVAEVLTSHFLTAVHVERLWFADNNPTCEPAQQYKSIYV